MLKIEADRFIEEVMRPLWPKWEPTGIMVSLWCKWLSPYDWQPAKRAVESHKRDSRLNEPVGKSVIVLAEQYMPTASKKTTTVPNMEPLRFIYAATDCPGGPKAGTIINFHLPEPSNDEEVWQKAAEQMAVAYTHENGGLWLVGRGGYAAANRTRYEIHMENKNKTPDAITEDLSERKSFKQWTREAPKTRSLDFRRKLIRLIPGYAATDPEAAKSIRGERKPTEHVMAEFVPPEVKQKKFDVCPELDEKIPF